MALIPSLTPSNEHARVAGNKPNEFATRHSLSLFPHALANSTNNKEAGSSAAKVAGIAEAAAHPGRDGGCDANDTIRDSVSTMLSHEDYVSMALAFFSSQASPQKDKAGGGPGLMHNKGGNRFGGRLGGPDKAATTVLQRAAMPVLQRVGRAHEAVRVHQNQSIYTDMLPRQRVASGRYTSHQAALGAEGGRGRDTAERDGGISLPSLSIAQAGGQQGRAAAVTDNLPLLPSIRAGGGVGRQAGTGREAQGAPWERGRGGERERERERERAAAVRMHGYAHSSRGQSLQGHPTLVVERHGVKSGEDDCDEDDRMFEWDARVTLAEHGKGVFSFKPHEPERPGGPADEEGRGGGHGAAATGKRRANGRIRGEGGVQWDMQGGDHESMRQDRRMSHAAAHAAATAASAAAAAAAQAAAAAAEAAVAVLGPRAYSSGSERV